MTSGTFVEDTLVPSGGACYYESYENTTELYECLSGSWTLLSGGSNMGGYTTWFGNQLSPLMFGDIKTQSLIGWVDILDVVWAPRGEVYLNSSGTGYCADDLEQWCEDSDSS